MGKNVARTRGSFETELGLLREELLKMGGLVSRALRDSVEALRAQDLDLAQAVVDGDEVIDELEHQIEQRCLMLLALQQPMAVDLRAISATLKTITDLERMADHASDIAKVALRIGHEPLIKPLVDIPRMASIIGEMLDGGIKALVTRDVALARQLAARDEEVDHLYGQIYRELLTYMMEDPRTIRQATSLLFVGSHLERVADHVTNLSEWVIYMVQGERCDLNT